MLYKNVEITIKSMWWSMRGNGDDELWIILCPKYIGKLLQFCHNVKTLSRVELTNEVMYLEQKLFYQVRVHFTGLFCSR